MNNRLPLWLFPSRYANVRTRKFLLPMHEWEVNSSSNQISNVRHSSHARPVQHIELVPVGISKTKVIALATLPRTKEGRPTRLLHLLGTLVHLFLAGGRKAEYHFAAGLEPAAMPFSSTSKRSFKKKWRTKSLSPTQKLVSSADSPLGLNPSSV